MRKILKCVLLGVWNAIKIAIRIAINPWTFGLVLGVAFLYYMISLFL